MTLALRPKRPIPAVVCAPDMLGMGCPQDLPGFGK